MLGKRGDPELEPTQVEREDRTAWLCIRYHRCTAGPSIILKTNASTSKSNWTEILAYRTMSENAGYMASPFKETAAVRQRGQRADFGKWGSTRIGTTFDCEQVQAGLVSMRVAAVDKCFLGDRTIWHEMSRHRGQNGQNGPIASQTRRYVTNSGKPCLVRSSG